MKTLIVVSMMIPLLLLILLLNMNEKNMKNKEKKTPFECGFNTIMNKKMMFSTNFIMITMMFLIFDVEIFILIPFILLSKTPHKNAILLALFFVLILTVLMMKEWKQGSLEWNK